MYIGIIQGYTFIKKKPLAASVLGCRGVELTSRALHVVEVVLEVVVVVEAAHRKRHNSANFVS